jgi:hypothetical protein
MQWINTKSYYFGLIYMRNSLREIVSGQVKAKYFSVSLALLIAALMFLSTMPVGTSCSSEGVVIDEIIPIDNATLMPVNLGTSGNFAILAKSGITTTGITAVVGDIGVSPIASTAMTGFTLIMDSSNQFATSTLVTGNVYAADYADPTPTMMITAISDMELAYADAAGRINPDFIDLNTGEIGGLTLVPGLYKWNGVVTLTTDVTIAGSDTDIWIFQIAGGFTVASDAKVILTGGAKAENIFWQVSGVASLGTDSIVNGIILSATSITMTAGATLNGRALAQTAVTLISNTINSPETIPVPIPDTTAPWVVSTSPSKCAKKVAINSVITATFNEEMDPLTINSISFTVKEGKKAISGVVTYSGLTAVFTPTTYLKRQTTYTATITIAATDLAGNALIKKYVWTFTTGNTTPQPPPNDDDDNGHPDHGHPGHGHHGHGLPGHGHHGHGHHGHGHHGHGHHC